MKHIIVFAILLALLPLAVSAQEERADTVIPKFLSNGYFFREMPQLPDGEKTLMRLKDKEGNSVVVINVNATLPKSLIRKAIPREQVHNEGEPFPQFSEKDIEGRTWTSDSIRGHVMVINLWYSGCGPCRAEMPILSKWKEQLPDVMFFSATYHDAETAKRITDKHHFTWTHLVEAKDMMAWVGTEGFPLTIVVDKRGIVRHAVQGTNETKREELLAKIKEAEAESL